MYKPEFNSAKFRELITYISYLCEVGVSGIKVNDHNHHTGFTTLIATLFYSDFLSFVYNDRQPITGATYEKLSVMPYPREFPQAKQELIDSGEVTELSRQVFRGTVTRLEPVYLSNRGIFDERFGNVKITDVKLSDAFTDDEAATVHMVFEELKMLKPKEIVSLLQDEVGWQVTNVGEAIPYETAFLVPSGDIDAWIDSIPTGKQIIKERQL